MLEAIIYGMLGIFVLLLICLAWDLWKDLMVTRETILTQYEQAPRLLKTEPGTIHTVEGAPMEVPKARTVHDYEEGQWR